ncbi:phosphatase PAP2 family protein [Hoeflea prorocentri]|uniref:Phosphatase PAP2 family protein n=1 Tax=Hoeflea prorocentri TaxID=1922333 RepID=A0A9X3UQ85_9HYPH|nr:phosphatase PAP2 family protein [Hoeflea prorocentri]MCY6383196.1 phosphatase PAP2 family protein [Hoeflea prorocentri]MDA5400996.1 phosphatase PAP2 family protein [Hoeflea prorocentri]
MDHQDKADTENPAGFASSMRAVGRRLSDRFRSNVVANRSLLKRRQSFIKRSFRVRGWRYLFLTVMVVILVAVVLDNPVGAYRHQWPADILRWAFRLTDIGKSGWILVPTGILVLAGFLIDWSGFKARTRLVMAKWVAASAYIFLSVGISGLIVAVLKRVIGRARPVHYEELGAFYFQPFSNASFASFPSGHSTTSGAFFAAVAIFFPSLRFPALVLAVWLGFTRVLVGAHYPSDVIAGVAFGAWYAYFTALFFAGYGILFKVHENGMPVRRPGYQLQKFLLRG